MNNTLSFRDQLLDAVRHFANLNQTEKALRHGDRLLEMNLLTPEERHALYRLLAGVADNGKQSRLAVRYLRHALRQMPMCVATWVELARVEMARLDGKALDATRDRRLGRLGMRLTNLAKKHRGDAELLLVIGQLQSRRRREDVAAKWAVRAARLQMPTVEFLGDVVETLCELGEVSVAKRLMAREQFRFRGEYEFARLRANFRWWAVAAEQRSRFAVPEVAETLPFLKLHDEETERARRTIRCPVRGSTSYQCRGHTCCVCRASASGLAMPHDFVSRRIRGAGGVCAFQVYGKATYEAKWHVIDCMVTHRRDMGGKFPLVSGTLITWTHSIIALGWDFARWVLEEQRQKPCSREFPLAVTGGRLRDVARREAAGGSRFVSCSEIIAHECGHTGQARRMKAFYWPIGTALTLFREGKYAWNRFENQASETGLFGGIVTGSVVPELRSVLE